MSEISPQGTSKFPECFDLCRFASFKEESSRQISFRVIYLSAKLFCLWIKAKSNFFQIAESFEKSICLQSKNYMALISLRCPNHYGNIKRSCLHYTNLLEVSAKKKRIPNGSAHRKCPQEVSTGRGYRKWTPEMWIWSRICWTEQN